MNIFISYAREDTDFVRLLAERLADDFDVWWDTDIIAGELFEQRILKVLRETRIVLCLVSHASVESEWVRKEVDAAVELNLTIIPIVIDGVDLPAWLAHLNAIFLDIEGLTEPGVAFARLMRDLSLYRVTAPVGVEGATSRKNVWSRVPMLRFKIGIFLICAAVAVYLAWFLIPWFLKNGLNGTDWETAEWQQEVEDHLRKRALGEIFTDEQAAWVQSALDTCDIAHAKSQATSQYYSDSQAIYAAYSSTSRSVSIDAPTTISTKLGSGPSLAEYCRSEFRTSEETTTLCRDSLRYFGNYGTSKDPLPLPFRIEKDLVELETGRAEKSAEGICSVAGRVEAELEAAKNPLTTQYRKSQGLGVLIEGLPHLSELAACYRLVPYSAEGLNAQSEGQFVSIEDRLLNAGCIETGAPEAIKVSITSVSLIVDATHWESDVDRETILLEKEGAKRLASVGPELLELRAQINNNRGVVLVFSDNLEDRRRGFLLLADAAKGGNIEARANMGLCQMLGIGVPANPSAGSANIRAAIVGGLDPKSATWAWRESLQRFAVGDAIDAVRKLERQARSGDPVAKAYNGLLRAQGLATSVCRPSCIAQAETIAKELRLAGHADLAIVVEDAVKYSEEMNSHLKSAASGSLKLSPTAAAPARPKKVGPLTRLVRMLKFAFRLR